jgi:hypothetical protein
MNSKWSVVIVSAIFFIAGFFYYPKWSKVGSEGTISWDASGYYHYLPGLFIYHDLKQQVWMEDINKKYLPSPALDQTFVHEASGNKVNKYAIGQAVLFSPFFFIGHAYTKLTGSYPADGYSKPYQVAIWLGGFLFAVLGLILLRRILLNYFEDSIAAWTLLTIGLATNYLEHASINNAMNHGWLFTLLCALIFYCVKFYKKPSWTSVLGIGISLGLAVLTRPTEIIWVLIPLLWGIKSIKERISFLIAHWPKILIAVLISGLIISLQMVYWKFVANEWIIYTYRDQKLEWLHPRIWKGLVDVRIGWWTYAPIMLFAMIGWPGLYRKYKSIFWPVLITSLLAIYITLCWKYFAGGVGQRNLIQMYPLMAFPLGMSISWMVNKKSGQWIWAGLFILNVYYNGWWIHQAHKGSFLQAGQMNTSYFFKVAGRLHPNKDYLKLLDTREYFEGKPTSLHILQVNDFDSDTSAVSLSSHSGGRVILLSADQQFYGPVQVSFPAEDYQWLRVEADFTIQSREWDVWNYTQWIVQFIDGEQLIKTNSIRLQRLIKEDHVPTHIFFDVKIPRERFTKCKIILWNAESSGVIIMDNFKATCFQ